MILLFTSGPAAGEAIGQMKGHPLSHSSLSIQEYRDLLSREGFRDPGSSDRGS